MTEPGQSRARATWPVVRGLGPLALHGGGEFLPGDETFGLALLELAAGAAAHRAGGSEPTDPDGAAPAAVRVLIVPTAAARHRPELSARDGVSYFEGLAGATRSAVHAEALLLVDPSSVNDSRLAGRIAGSDLLYFPGGDPDLIPALLAGSPAWRGILAARAHGAVLAGASAGAMALAERTWTPRGWVAGLGLLRGIAIRPHFTPGGEAWSPPAGLGMLGLPERTGVVGWPESGEDAAWRVVGQGCVQWRDPGAGPAVTACPGEELRLRLR